MFKPKFITVFLFLLPTTILFLVIFATPLVTVFSTSFTDWTPRRGINFIGIKNYITLFTSDAVFKKSIGNTFKWVFLQCTINVGLGLLVALLTQKATLFSRILRTVYLIPNIISRAALSVMFFFVFHPTIGLVNSVVQKFIPDFKQNWYFQKDTAFFAVTMTTILFAGVVTLIMSAQIASIDSCLYESAKIDGAGSFRQAISITIPLLKNTIATALILAATGALKSFEVIFLTTGGGPGSETMNLPVLMYQTYMTKTKYGYGNTMGVVVIVLGIIFMVTINKFVKTKEY